MDSIFRKKRTYNVDLDLNYNLNPEKQNFKTVTHDFGYPRARKYSLTCQLHFTEYSGYTIKNLIETNFNYFTWLPRNIRNFTYDEDVLKYANTCLDWLEKIENYPTKKKFTDLGRAINQVRTMIDYEHCLDFENDEIKSNAYKMMINVEYYKTIINTPIEKLIRQTFEIHQNSSEYRRKYFEKINIVE